MTSDLGVVIGVVRHGDARGRQLGYPTANIVLADLDAPIGLDDGVYAGTARRSNGEVRLAAISIGTRPMFHGVAGQRLLEAHLLDFDDDLYDEELTVLVSQAIREQQVLTSVEELVARIGADVDAVRSWASDDDKSVTMDPQPGGRQLYLDGHSGDCPGV